MRRALVLAVLLASPASAQAVPTAREVEVLVEAIRAGDDAARTAALGRLGEVAAHRPSDLEPWLAHPDPDVRFQVLYLLSARDARTEQRVRQIVEGQPALAGTYPQALAARAAILEQAAREAVSEGAPTRTLDLLVRLARARAPVGDVGPRYVVVALDLVGDVVRKHCRGGRGAAEAAGLLAGLVEHDLGVGNDELVVCFAALPPESSLSALRGVIASGTPMARARAALLLAEVTDPARAEIAGATVLPLLSHPLAEVRLAALEALSLLSVGPVTLVPAAALAQDKDPDVARGALRLAGERGIAFAREAAERLAGDGAAPASLRKQAVVTLGLLGNPASAPPLRALVRQGNDRELRVLAAWALGAMRAQGAVELIQGMLATAELRDEPRLYCGLARGGLPGVQALAAMLEPGGGNRARRAFAIEALGKTTPDPQGEAPRAAVEALARLARQPLAMRLGDGGGAHVTESELEGAGRALGDLAPHEDAARAALARLVVERGEAALLDKLLPIVAEVGPPLDPGLAQRLETQLAGLVLQHGGQLRPLAAQAYLKVAPQKARELVGRLVGVGRGGQTEEGLELMHVLARAGDPGPVRSLALPLARARLEEEDQVDRRFDAQNRVGIELLYAHQLDEAVLEFRRMLWCRPDDAIGAYNIACGHSLGGRVEDALRALRRTIRNKYRNPVHMTADADLDPLRADPRYKRIIERLRLEAETSLRQSDDEWPGRGDGGG